MRVTTRNIVIEDENKRTNLSRSLSLSFSVYIFFVSRVDCTNHILDRDLSKKEYMDWEFPCVILVFTLLFLYKYDRRISHASESKYRLYLYFRTSRRQHFSKKILRWDQADITVIFKRTRCLMLIWDMFCYRVWWWFLRKDRWKRNIIGNRRWSIRKMCVHRIRLHDRKKKQVTIVSYGLVRHTD